MSRHLRIPGHPAISRPMRIALATCLALLLVVTASACSSKSGDPNKVTGTITVSAAASLTEVFTQLASDFKAANPDVKEVKFNFDGSSSLATQIEEGASADVFASADEKNMAKLTENGLVDGQPTVFAKNTMVIATMAGNPQAIEEIADLSSGFTVSLCGSDVPCGAYADQILDNAGVSIPPEHLTRSQNVKATLRAVSTGDADAGIVYLTDAIPEASNVAAVEIPDDINVITDYPIATVTTSKNKKTAAAFIDYVMSDEGQATLRKAGFRSPQ